MDLPAPRKDLRWEGDTRGEGVASAAAEASRLDVFRGAVVESAWVAEEPEIHLWPGLAATITAEGSPWSAARHSTDEAGRFVVELDYARDSSFNLTAFRRRVLALLGGVIEGASYIEISDKDRGGVVVVSVVTGSLDDQTPFRSHGHTLKLLITVSPAAS